MIERWKTSNLFKWNEHTEKFHELIVGSNIFLLVVFVVVAQYRLETNNVIAQIHNFKTVTRIEQFVRRNLVTGDADHLIRIRCRIRNPDIS